MFELPEYTHLAGQLKEHLSGRVVREGSLGNSPHKFVWYNREPGEFAALVREKTVGGAWVKGRFLFLPLQPGHVLALGECGGRIILNGKGATWPKKYHLSLTFKDGSFLTVTTQMWGAMELHDEGKELEGPYVKDMRPTPTDPTFTPEYLYTLIHSEACGPRSAKGLLTQEQLVPGLGNAIAQDILFRAGLSPRHPVRGLSKTDVATLHRIIVELVSEIAEKGGRNDETDLFGNPGGYARMMDKGSPGTPCPRCGGEVKKIQYLGGACYFCTGCQK